MGEQDQQRHDDDSAADAEERAEEPGDQADDEVAHRRILRGVEDRLARLRSEPGRAAVLLDVDGTLAPIVARPELAAVPEETREEVRRLAGRYALVACVSGRPGEEAARLVGVEGVVYVGVHGLELAPEAERWREALRPFAGEDWPWLEDKGLTVAFHWREAPDEEEARRSSRRSPNGRGRPGSRRTGGARCWSCGRRSRPTRALRCGRCSPSAGSSGRSTPATTRPTSTPSAASTASSSAVRVAVASPEGPAELREAADLVVDSPAELLELLRTL